MLVFVSCMTFTHLRSRKLCKAASTNSWLCGEMFIKAGYVPLKVNMLMNLVFVVKGSVYLQWPHRKPICDKLAAPSDKNKQDTQTIAGTVILFPSIVVMNCIKHQLKHSEQ
ncbi:hypothetical protein PR048_016046 [Dryococelus australis]|uniref:Uncharacterized protein n=1 Tax=Dryococelus australis TaxID=614101 RepID=A0ABQ9HIN0_9NEOP|nr:hypothetical protein PR048_016046 [Dryococelus australis]